MKTNTKHGLIIVGIIAALGGGYYIWTHTKTYYAKAIATAGNVSNYLAVLSFDKGFLQAWYLASKGKTPVFVYNSKAYNTAGGTAIVANTTVTNTTASIYGAT